MSRCDMRMGHEFCPRKEFEEGEIGDDVDTSNSNEARRHRTRCVRSTGGRYWGPQVSKDPTFVGGQPAVKREMHEPWRVVGKPSFWGATVPEGNLLPLLSLTASPVPAVLLSQTFRSICVRASFSGSKWFRPGCALNHAGSDRWPLSTARTLQFLRGRLRVS